MNDPSPNSAYRPAASASRAREILAMARDAAEARQFATAEHMAHQALAITRETLGDDHAETAMPLSCLAWIHAERADYARAEAYALAAMRVLEATHQQDSLFAAGTSITLAYAMAMQGKAAGVEVLFAQALAQLRRHLVDTDPVFLLARLRQAQACLRLDQHAEAARIARETLSRTEHLPSSPKSVRHRLLSVLAQALSIAGDTEPALGYAELALEEARMLHGQGSFETASCHALLWQLHLARKDQGAAWNHAERVLDIATRAGVPEGPDANIVRAALASARRAELCA